MISVCWCIHSSTVSSNTTAAAAGTMRLSLSLPRVEAVDLRPWVPPEHALVISSEHTNPDGSYRAAQQAKDVAWPPPSNSPAHLMKPSFLTVEFCAQQSLSRQKVKHTSPLLLQGCIHFCISVTGNFSLAACCVTRLKTPTRLGLCPMDAIPQLVKGGS